MLSFTCYEGDIVSFVKKYEFEIANAENIYKNLDPEFKIQSKKYGNDKVFISAIIFPELIRYSIYRDFFETTILEYYYVKNGSKSANFSIGVFQMKPSFVEQLEKQVKSDTLLKKYNSIITYKSINEENKRKLRLERMKLPKWQITYINCFYDIIRIKYATEVFKTIDDKLAFFATAYNHGFNSTKEEIYKWTKIKSFPNGVNSKMEKYSYSEISVYYYNKTKE